MNSLFEWFQQLRTRRPSTLEARIASLEVRLQDLARGNPAKADPASAVVIEHVNIEHLHIAKLEHSNNFGALGIKELGGRLNIGVNYSGPITSDALEEMADAAGKPSGWEAGKENAQPNATRSPESPPVCHIRSKPL